MVILEVVIPQPRQVRVMRRPKTRACLALSAVLHSGLTKIALAGVLALAATLIAAEVFAQNYPTKPIRFIVGPGRQRPAAAPRDRDAEDARRDRHRARAVQDRPRGDHRSRRRADPGDVHRRPGGPAADPGRKDTRARGVDGEALEVRARAADG